MDTKDNIGKAKNKYLSSGIEDDKPIAKLKIIIKKSSKSTFFDFM